MRVAFVSARPPFPLNSGGRLRTYHLLKQVSAVHRVTLITAFETAAEACALDGLIDAIPQLAVRAVQVPQRGSFPRKMARLMESVTDPLPYTWAAFNHPRFVENLGCALAERSYDLVHCDHVQIAATAASLARSPCLLNAHNVESVLIGRLADRHGRGWRRGPMRWQARKTIAAERAAFSSMHACVTVSEIDRHEVHRLAPSLRVAVVPNGVDVGALTQCGIQRRRGLIVFCGAMDWAPNIDAVRWFAEAILPGIRLQLPVVEFLVVGRNPGRRLQQRLKPLGVTFTDTVPDVRPHLGQAHAVVVPLRSGSGTRLKILEAWAMKKPVVSTTLGAEGLPADDGVNILLANTAQEFADRTVSLLVDDTRACKLAENGRQRVEKSFDWKCVADLLLQTYEDTVARGPRSRVGAVRASPSRAAIWYSPESA